MREMRSGSVTAHYYQSHFSKAGLASFGNFRSHRMLNGAISMRTLFIIALTGVSGLFIDHYMQETGSFGDKTMVVYGSVDFKKRTCSKGLGLEDTLHRKNISSQGGRRSLSSVEI
jgi:hypothetical protein